MSEAIPVKPSKPLPTTPEDEVPQANSPRRNTVATPISPRLGPLLGVARSSPVVKRKEFGSRKKSLGSEDELSLDGETSPRGKKGVSPAPSGSHAAFFAKKSPESAPSTPKSGRLLDRLETSSESSSVTAKSPRSPHGTMDKKMAAELQKARIVPNRTSSSGHISPRSSNATTTTATTGGTSSPRANSPREASPSSPVFKKKTPPPSIASLLPAFAGSASLGGGLASGGADESMDFDANDTVETLKGKLEMQKVRYEKWKQDHLAETRTKFVIMAEENNRLEQALQEKEKALSEKEKESLAWKLAYEELKALTLKSTEAWNEERAKLNKRHQEDQKKIEKLSMKKMGSKGVVGLPKEVTKSGFFGKGRTEAVAVERPSPPSSAAGSVVVGSPGPSIGEPRLLQPKKEVDSTPLPLARAPEGKTPPAHRIRTPEDFELRALIGQGGFGSVFLCREVGNNRCVAVKRMSKNMIVAKEQVHTVNVEVNVLKEARQENSNWLVQFYYAFQDKYFIYLAMEFCSGGDVRNLMDNVELDEDGVRFLAAEMIVAVNSLHERGYVHRDLKPSNFLIASTGHLKLADFGLSKSGFSGVKKTDNEKPQAIRIFLADDAYKTLIVTGETTVSEVIKQLKMKERIAKNAPWLLYECNTISGLVRERPMAMDERPIKVTDAWQKGLQYRFVFKQADSSRVAAMARTKVETSHRDPFFQGQTKQSRRERMYSVVGSPHYMAAEILEGSGYDAVADWWSMGCILYEMLVGAPPFTGNTAEEVFAAVLKSAETLKFPPKNDGTELSESSKDLIRRFLSPPQQRLGFNGVGEIKAHDFFSSINWVGLHLMTPPFEPSLEDEYDCGYFEAATTDGIEGMQINAPPKDEEEAVNPDPWEKGWDWSDTN